jgi:hypothetical protein
MVEIGQSHSAAVQFIENRAESIEEHVIEPGSRPFPQWLGVDPTRGQSVGSETTEKCRQGLDGSRRLIGRGLAPYQPATEAVPNHGASRLIGLDRNAIAIQLIEEDIGLGTVTSYDSSNRFGS